MIFMFYEIFNEETRKNIESIDIKEFMCGEI